MTVEWNQVSSLLEYLPAVYQEDREAGRPNFLGRFLLAFEQVLLGLGQADVPGLEEVIAKIYRYFEPGERSAEEERVPRDFLPWLAGWVAITLREDWEEARQRHLIARASELYRLRGTMRGIEEFIRIYTVLGARIDELNSPFQIGARSHIGVDTYLDGGAPFFFRVHVFVVSALPDELRRARTMASAIVDLQKPAHTYYALTVEAPTLAVEVHSTIGQDTLLG